MSNSENIDAILKEWAFDANNLAARIVEGDDGRDVLQMRIEMGIMQLELTGRPDGTRPHDCESYYHYLVRQSEKQPNFALSDDDCFEVDREFVQFYHRRICWLGIRDYQNASADATHTLELMDLCRKFSDDPDWVDSHEQFRPFVMFHCIQATALAELDQNTPASAIEVINQGLEDLRTLFEEYEIEEAFEEDELVIRLTELREKLRNQYEVGQTLYEQLSEAVAKEQYELAAKLKSKITKR